MVGPREYRPHLYAELGYEPADGPYIGVSSRPGGDVTSYTLRYWNPRKGCAVYTTDKYNRIDCELHVRQRNLGGRFYRCERRYNRYCRGIIFQLFSEACLY
ncbi:uncharacterized protein LOC125941599 [Dermacentor silvarum]|uniref:uncharacterized protein LOC125941599 n=1 Tax=Dermacentor silvarum TaxID=543639 RepID=UPI0021018380|nr:uncharacterized protein LOC125941599 [Dermacentor silvarum]